MTPNSSIVSYCPVTEFLKRVDLRTVGDWASDTGVRVIQPALATDPNVASALMSASGMFEAALLKGQRYQPSDVLLMIGLNPDGSSIPGFTATAGTAFVYTLISRLAEGELWRRRPDLSPYPPMFDWAMEQLEELEFGGKILAFLETQAAGIPGHHVDVTTEVEARGLVVTQAKRFLGTRGAELNG
jgi:hypothetical protein